MRFIPEAESAALISHEMAFDAVREALMSVTNPQTSHFPVVLAHGSNHSNTFSVKASATHELAGLKVGSFWPDNPQLGLPRHNSLILLFDQQIGKIHAAIEAGKVNAYRTAAADAVAADVLLRKDVQTLAVFGTGHQARYECEALLRIRDFKQVLIVGRRHEKAQHMADELSALGVNACIAHAQAACEQADMIVTATPSRVPLFKADWVKPGTHIAAMGADAVGKQELPPELFQHSRLFCDLPSQSRNIGEFQHAPSALAVTAIGHVLTGEGHVLTGENPGRTGNDEITIFDSSGLSVQDLYIGSYLLKVADERAGSVSDNGRNA